ncbi:MAG TPA: S-adenosylmethionine decarboxylase [Gemmatimonadaceae bacterium]
MADPPLPAFSHLSADLLGIDADRLRDTTVLAGLLIASAGAAGFTTVGAPIVHRLPSDDVTGVLLLDHCHIVIYAFPERRLLLLDVLASATSDARKALDVFARRLEPREVRSETRARG